MKHFQHSFFQSGCLVALALSLLTALPALAGPDMSAPEALAAAQAGKVKLIDIRTPAEWRETGTAPGAGRVDFYRGPQVLTQYLEQQTKGDKNAPIALICRTGNRTAQAQRYLQSLGYTQVWNVKEGMKGSTAGPGWLKRGLPVDVCSAC
jgi:rhodanese-related sulfurtransferase